MYPHLDWFAAPVDKGVYIMYHGTTKAAAAAIQRQGFKPSEDGMLGEGVYLSRDLQKASRYPLDHPEHDKAVVRVLVNVGRVKKIDYQGHPRQYTWYDYGYDTAWVPPNCGMVPSGLEEDCVWDPDRIDVIDILYPKLPQQGWPVASAIYLQPTLYSNPGVPMLAQQVWPGASAFYPHRHLGFYHPAPLPLPLQSLYSNLGLPS